jgi:hypothetical protein
MGRRDMLLLSILTFVTALGWIAFDVYHASVENTTPQDVEDQLAPVMPTFNTGLIEDLKNRETIDPSTIDTGKSVFSQPASLPLASSSATNTATPSVAQTQSPR